MEIELLALAYLFFWTIAGFGLIFEGYGLWSDDPYPFFSMVPGPWDMGAMGARALGGLVMWLFWWPLFIRLI